MKKQHHLGTICTPFYLLYIQCEPLVLYYLVMKLAAVCTLQLLMDAGIRPEIA